MKAFLFILPALMAGFLCGSDAGAHSWYSNRTDPVLGNSCCGGHDCAPLVITPGVLTAEADGYRIRLTVVQAQAINPYISEPVDILVPWDRVQESEDGGWHLCLPAGKTHPRFGGLYCLFAPPQT